MAELTKYSVDNKLGCGLIGGIFQRRSYFSGKSSVPSLPTKTSKSTVDIPSTISTQKPPSQNSKRRRGSSADSALIDSSIVINPASKSDQSPGKRHSSVTPRPSISSSSHQKQQSRRLSDAERSSTLSNPSSAQLKLSSQVQVTKQRKERSSNSKELSKVLETDQESKNLVRVTSSNVMLLSKLGNLRQLGNGGALGNNSPNATVKTVDYLYSNIQDINSVPKPKYGTSRLGANGAMGNIVRQPSSELSQCRSLVNRLDPEVLKSRGNEAYKQGRFDEALGLYDRAIALESNKATYRSNRSAALIGLGRLVEAVFECKEAIRIDPSYQRAHHRLANLYLRLGEAEKALCHYKQSGSCAHSKDMAQAQALQKRFNLCIDAQKSEKWSDLLKETESVISTGADSAPQVYAMQAEALLKLQKHQEAYDAYKKGPNFGVDLCTKFFGLARCAYLFMIGAQVYMATGRFEEAVATSRDAIRCDPSDKEVGDVAKKARAVASARLSGNLLFKASKFLEACIAYSEGLEHDPHNSVLLSNRAACRSKLAQFEKAIEDCTTALGVRASYSKARLRRADCNAKLERWEASIQDYEMLIRETPGDEEVGRALFEAQVQLKKQHGEDIKDMKFGCNLVVISSNERFRHFVTSPGMSVVLFCNKAKHKQVSQILEQVGKRFPSVNFLKVVVEDNPYLAKSEGVSSIPAFKIYKNGSRVKEIPANNRELLETSVKLYST